MTPEFNALPTAAFLVAALVLFILGFILGRKDGAKFGALEAKVETFVKEKTGVFENKWAEITTLYGVVHEHVQKGVAEFRAEAKALVEEAQAEAAKAKADLEAAKTPVDASAIVTGSITAGAIQATALKASSFQVDDVPVAAAADPAPAIVPDAAAPLA